MLPLVDEIRAARASLAEAQRAALDLAEVDGVVAGIDVARRVRGAVAPIPEGLCARLSAAWGLPPRASEAEILAEAQRHLRPRARSLMRRADEMIELQLRQQEALGAPEHREIAGRIAEAVHARDHLVHELTPYQQQIAVIEPSLQTVGAFVERVREAERAADAGEDPRAAWRAAAMASTLLRSLEGLLREVKADLVVPTMPDPGGAGTARAAEHRETAARGREALEELRSRLSDRLGSLRETAAPLEAERQRLDAWLLEQLG